MRIAKAYSYLFYKLYRFWEDASTPKFWSDWKAELTIDVLEILFGFSMICYYTVASNKWAEFLNDNYSVLIYIVLIALPNYFFFHHQNQWKEIVKEFDQLPKKKNEIGSLIVWGVVFAIVGNFIFAFYLLSQMD